MISARFDKQHEDRLMLDEIELYINLGIFRNLTQNRFDNSNFRFQLEHQIINQEMKNSGWRFEKN